MFVTRDVPVGGRTWKITSIENQDQLLQGVKTDHDVEYFPYGLLLWVSAIGLAEHLVESPDLIAGKRVLEIGCGVGLAGLVASQLGGAVTQTDYLAEAIDLAARNAEQNGIRGVDRLQADWREFPSLDPYDLVLGSDVLYERTMHPVLKDLLPRLVTPTGFILLSDPVRPQALDFIAEMEGSGWAIDIESRFVEWEEDRREVALYTLQR